MNAPPYYLIISLLFALPACKNKKSNTDKPVSADAEPGKPEEHKPFDLPATAEADVEEQESATQEGVVTVEPPRNRNYLSLSKNLLDKEFLLQINITYMSPAPEFNGLKSRIITFKKNDKSVLMLEVLRGKSVQPGESTGAVLAKIPVVQETEQDLELDFNSGVSRLFLMGDTYASDFAGRQYNATAGWRSAEFSDSYMKTVTYNKENESFSIQQAGRISFTEVRSGGKVEYPVDVTYYLQTYKPDPDYIPINYYNKKFVGFFEISPQIRKGGGEDLVLSARFNLRGERKIKFYISKNTPPEYQEAVKRGVLYWNSVFGREALEVEIHEKETHEITSAVNLIHWIEWNNAPYAYADMRADPLTGEIRNAQVFLTSAFAVNNKRQARILQNSFKSFQAPDVTLDPGLLGPVEGKDAGELKSFRDSFKVQWEAINHSAFGESVNKMVGIKGFQTENLCSMKVTRNLMSELTGILSSPEEIESRSKKLSEDILTTVVAHEIGHTLGLRHNFAGNLAANFEYSAHGSLIREYVLNDIVPDQLFGNTVMDYYPFSDMAVIGAWIRKEKPPLAYDKKAVGVLYNGAALDVGDKVLFCTDTHRAEYADCNVFDSGSDMISYFGWQEIQGLARLPYVISELFIRALYPPAGYDKIPLRDIELSPEYFAMGIIANRFALMNSLQREGKYLRVRGLYPVVNDLNEKSIREEEKKYLNSVVTAERLKEFLKGIPDTIGDELYKDLEKALSGDYKSFTHQGKKVSLSAEEAGGIKEKGRLFFDAFAAALQKWDIILATVPRNFADLEAVNTTLPDILGEKIYFTVTEKSENSLKAIYTDSQAETDLSIFKFGFPLRVFAAMGFSNQSVEGNALWGIRSLEEKGKAIYTFINDTAFGQENAHSGQGLELLKTSYKKWSAKENPALERQIHNWIYENQKLLMLFKSQTSLY